MATNLFIQIVNNPVYLATNIILRVGYYSQDNSLLDVTDQSTFEILDSPEEQNITTTAEANVFYANKLGGVHIKATYIALGSGTYTATTSFMIVAPLALPNSDNIFNAIKRLLPENVYTLQLTNPDAIDSPKTPTGMFYADMKTTSDLTATQYQELGKMLKDIYPNSASDIDAWVDQLFDNLYINDANNGLIQFVRNLPFNSSLNPFDLAKTLTSYIYYRTGYKLYVYVKDEKVTIDTAWSLGVNGKTELGETTVLANIRPDSQAFIINVYDPNSIIINNVALSKEIFAFVSRNCPANLLPLIVYLPINVTQDGFNLIGMTYKGDPRIAWSYCLCYDSEAFFEVLGAQSITRPDINTMISFTVTPPDNSVIGQPTTISILGLFPNGYTYDVTNYIQKQEIDNKQCLYVMSNALLPRSAGNCQVRYFYPTLPEQILNYSVNIMNSQQSFTSNSNSSFNTNIYQTWVSGQIVNPDNMIALNNTLTSQTFALFSTIGESNAIISGGNIILSGTGNDAKITAISAGAFWTQDQVSSGGTIPGGIFYCAAVSSVNFNANSVVVARVSILQAGTTFTIYGSYVNLPDMATFNPVTDVLLYDGSNPQVQRGIDIFTGISANMMSGNSTRQSYPVFDIPVGYGNIVIVDSPNFSVYMPTVANISTALYNNKCPSPLVAGYSIRVTNAQNSGLSITLNIKNGDIAKFLCGSMPSNQFVLQPFSSAILTLRQDRFNTCYWLS